MHQPLTPPTVVASKSIPAASISSSGNPQAGRQQPASMNAAREASGRPIAELKCPLRVSAMRAAKAKPTSQSRTLLSFTALLPYRATGA